MKMRNKINEDMFTFLNFEVSRFKALNKHWWLCEMWIKKAWRLPRSLSSGGQPKKRRKKTICLSKNLILNVQIWEVSLVNERWNDSSFLSFSLQFRTLNFWGLCEQNGAIENKDFIKKIVSGYVFLGLFVNLSIAVTQCVIVSNGKLRLSLIQSDWVLGHLTRFNWFLI
jgi:hypothetical protein